MQLFIVRFDSGEYACNVRIGTNYIRYDRTTDKTAASRLEPFDSQLFLKRLKSEGVKAEREEA
jgi:hypothetical protein